MNMEKVYLSGLGMMGRRHLKGLVRAGVHVVAFDPDPASHAKGAADLSAAGLSPEGVTYVTEMPADTFDAAIFSETAEWRHKNLSSFLRRNAATRYLLEKPLSANPVEVEEFPVMLAQAGVPAEAISVNFPRRLWSVTSRLQELASDSSDVQVTINGGAFGLGCNGIHYLDAFLHLARKSEAEVLFCQLDDSSVASGRGSQFLDYGGRFLLRSGKATLFCSASASSSAPVMVTVRGDHFTVLVDETDLTWKILRRSPDSKLPNYRYGADYAVIEHGPFHIDNLDVVTERWIRREAALPSLEEAMPAHRLLHQILEAGGTKQPFYYT